MMWAASGDILRPVVYTPPPAAPPPAQRGSRRRASSGRRPPPFAVTIFLALVAALQGTDKKIAVATTVQKN